MSDCIDHGKTGNKRGYAYSHNVALHRRAYCQANGVTLDQIAGQLVLHSCDNPRCVNPEHLRLGTHQDNMDDRRVRQRGGRATAKLSYAIAEQIREDYRASGCTQHRLAQKYGVSQYIISRIINNKLWVYA